MPPVPVPALVPDLASPDMLLRVAGVVVVGAIAGEWIARSTRLPRVIGYTLAGWVAALGGFGAALPFDGPVRVLVDLALGVLLFEIGSRVRLRWLRHNPGLLATSVLEALAAAVAVGFALQAIGQPPAVAAACAVLAIPSSAALAGRVAFELRADGQVTQRMTVLTALDTLYGAVALVLLDAGLAAAGAPDPRIALATLAVSLGGALALAALLALAVGAAARRVDLRHEGAALLVLGLVMLAVLGAQRLGLSTLLVPLLAGVLLRNTTERAWSWPRHFGTAGGLLVLLLFVVVGSAWSVAHLLGGALAALVLLGARVAAKAGVVWALSGWSRLGMRKGFALSLTLTPLSATALVMLSELQRRDAGFGAQVAPIVVAAVAGVELLGPVAVTIALRWAGEGPDAPAVVTARAA
ncbi:MAG: cation:proton antiporter [Burkholderiales bacterium]|jgi:Kef-type K+ transport system membrane component KefB|nr:cation:proton antiporter [Burkholderiales bacterium]